MLPLRLRITLKRLALPAAIALLYCYAFPYFHSIHSANELPRIYQAMAIVDRHALDIGPEMRARHGTPDTATYRGKLYPNKAPGMSFLAVPAYAVYRWTHDGPPPRELRPLFFWLRLTASTIPSLLFLLLLARLLRAFSSARQARWLTLLGFGLGTMALVYGTVLVAHQLSAALIGSAFAVICLRGRGSPSGPIARRL